MLLQESQKLVPHHLFLPCWWGLYASGLSGSWQEPVSVEICLSILSRSVNQQCLDLLVPQEACAGQQQVWIYLLNLFTVSLGERAVHFGFIAVASCSELTSVALTVQWHDTSMTASAVAYP